MQLVLHLSHVINYGQFCAGGAVRSASRTCLPSGAVALAEQELYPVKASSTTARLLRSSGGGLF